MPTAARGRDHPAVTAPAGFSHEGGIVPGLDPDEVDGSTSTEHTGPATGLPSNAGTAVTAGGRPFRVVFRGYDRDQVDHAVAALTERIAQLANGAMPSFDALGQRVTEILHLAESEAEQLRAAAASDAARIREDASRDAQELRRAAQDAVVVMRQRWAVLLAQMSAARDELTTILDRDSALDPAAEGGAPGPD